MPSITIDLETVNSILSPSEAVKFSGRYETTTEVNGELQLLAAYLFAF